MKKYRKYIINCIIFMLFNLLISFIYLYSNISYNIISSIKIISFLIFITIISYMISKNLNKKGIVIGSYIGLITITILVFLSFIFRCNFSARNILYYLIIFLCILFGSILSKNIKK